MQWLDSQWLAIGAFAIIGALTIKLFSKSRSNKTGLKTNTENLRLEPNANLPEFKKPVISYETNRFILSKSEQLFYKALHLGLSDQFLILMKVRACDVLKPKTGLNKTTWQITFNQINAKHFDFLLCNQDSYEIVAAIELDDSSHQSASRKKRDKFLNEACESAHFPLIRISARQIYAAQEIKAAILSALRDYRISKAA